MPLVFQSRVVNWVVQCFGEESALSKPQRSERFVEESIELAQATGMSKADVLTLVDYVYDRPVGEVHQEVGGVMMTLAALCHAQDVDMQFCGELELARVLTCIEKIRAKQSQKERDLKLGDN